MDKPSISEIIEDVKKELCDNYCKYPNMPIPEGEDEDWIIEICEHCPLGRL